ncbi:hypothetical protein [Sphingomonas sp. KR3-1]|uniref:hypothetical protein n=1 Tax=Sphingomonas sp. KR3-1 TaxID=3156611 RepID=UPI0032B4C394
MGYIDTLIDDLITDPKAKANAVQNADMYLGKPNKNPLYDEIPKCVYFYFASLDENNALKADHYFYSNGPIKDPAKWEAIEDGAIEQIITDLARNAAKPNGMDNVELLKERNFQNIIWRRVSYIAIVIDEVTWALHRRTLNQGAVAVNPKKSSKSSNACFYDADDFIVDTSEEQDRSAERTAVYFINHMVRQDEFGNLSIENDKTKYDFDFYFDVAFDDAATPRAIMILDPSGTNQGPPEQP